MSDDRLDQLDYYTLLSVEADATADDVKQAFRTFSRRYHPDRFAGDTPERQERAAQIFRRGAEAYKVLTHPQKRSRYDAGLREGKLRYDQSAEKAEQKPAAARRANALSPKARPFAQKAQQALKARDFKTARLNLQIALRHQPDSDDLKAMLAEVDDQLSSPG